MGSRGKIVDIVPLTIEPIGEDQYSIVAESILSFLVDSLRATPRVRESQGTRVTDQNGKVEATIWSNLMYGIPCSTLEKYLGSLPSQIIDCCRQIHEGKPSIVPEGFIPGYEPTSIFGESTLIEATLADELDILAAIDKGFLSF